jgi:hypothetical protein
MKYGVLEKNAHSFPAKLAKTQHFKRKKIGLLIRK